MKGNVVGIPDFVIEIVVVLVKGNVVGIDEPEREKVVDIEYDIETVFVLVKGKVVGIVDGDKEPVIDLVNGFEEGIADLETVTVTEEVGKLDG